MVTWLLPVSTNVRHDAMVYAMNNMWWHPDILIRHIYNNTKKIIVQTVMHFDAKWFTMTTDLVVERGMIRDVIPSSFVMPKMLQYFDCKDSRLDIIKITYSWVLTTLQTDYSVDTRKLPTSLVSVWVNETGPFSYRSKFFLRRFERLVSLESLYLISVTFLREETFVAPSKLRILYLDFHMCEGVVDLSECH